MKSASFITNNETLFRQMKIIIYIHKYNYISTILVLLQKDKVNKCIYMSQRLW